MSEYLKNVKKRLHSHIDAMTSILLGALERPGVLSTDIAEDLLRLSHRVDSIHEEDLRTELQVLSRQEPKELDDPRHELLG